MAVTLTWSSTNGGTAITSLNHGSGAAGSILTANEIFIRHNGLNSLSQCSFYLAGDPTDLAEVIEWGDAAAANDFGGFEINMRAITATQYDNWPTYSDKSPSGLDTHTFRTGFGDTTGNGITLAKNAGAINDGLLQAGSSPNVRFQMRVVVPTSEGTTGARTVSQKLRFTFTS